MADEWPSFSAELTRKTTEQLQGWADRYEKGQVALSTMMAAISTLYDVTSGMIEKEVSDLLADVHQELLREARNKVQSQTTT